MTSLGFRFGRKEPVHHQKQQQQQLREEGEEREELRPPVDDDEQVTILFCSKKLDRFKNDLTCVLKWPSFLKLCHFCEQSSSLYIDFQIASRIGAEP